MTTHAQQQEYASDIAHFFTRETQKRELTPVTDRVWNVIVHAVEGLLGEHEPEHLSSHEIDDDLWLFFVLQDSAHFMRFAEDEVEVRIAGPLSGGIYVERTKYVNDQGLTMTLTFQHERIPGGELRFDLNRRAIEENRALRDRLARWAGERLGAPVATSPR